MHSSERLGTLFVVATPIGNLKDITIRALEVLKSVDVVACEDTRRTRILLDYYRIEKPKLVSYHEHNERIQAVRLISLLEEGMDVALVSDAGTPCVSDPGFVVVKLAREKNIRVVPVPGPSAVITAVSASGFPAGSFYFAGFLPRKEGKLKKELEKLLHFDSTVVCFESPHRIERTLSIISSIAPEKRIGIFRELTKVNEEFLIGKAEEILENLKERNALKGEFVLLFPPGKDEIIDESEKVVKILEDFKNKGFPLKTAVKKAVEITGVPRNKVYEIALDVFGK